MINAAKLQNLPAYTVADAARYLRIPLGTLRAWLHGRTYNTKDGQQFSAPLIQRPSTEFSQLSFINLVEAHLNLRGTPATAYSLGSEGDRSVN